MKTNYDALRLVRLLGALGVLCVLQTGHAATYQTMFNNVEQGSHSTASPSLSVDSDAQGRQRVKRTLGATDATEKTSTETPTENSESANVVQTAMPTASFDDMKQNRFSIKIAPYHRFSGFSDDLKTKNQWDAYGLNLGLSYAFHHDFYAHVFGASNFNGENFAGAEVGFDPLHLRLFGLNDFLDLGLLLGASTLNLAKNDSIGTLHAGSRLRLNFGRQFSVDSTVRTNLTQRPESYLTADVGFSYHF